MRLKWGSLQIKTIVQWVPSSDFILFNDAHCQNFNAKEDCSLTYVGPNRD